MVGIAMAVGVGIALGSQNKVAKAEATGAETATTTHTVVFNMKGFAGLSADSYQNQTKSGTGKIDGGDSTVAATAYAFNAKTGQARGNKTSVPGASITSDDNSKNWELFNTGAINGSIKSILIKTGDTTTSSLCFKGKMYVWLGTTSRGSQTDVSDAQADVSASKVDDASYANAFSFTNLNNTADYSYFKLSTNVAFTTGSVTKVTVTVTYESYTASDFANDFLTETNSICSVKDDGNKTELEASWSKLNHANFYQKLSTAQKNILKNATYTYDQEHDTVTPGAGVAQNVANAVCRYDFLCQKYELANATFLNRNIAGYAGAVTPFNIPTSNNSTIIFVVSAVAVATIAAAGVFFALKKKHN